MKNRSKSRKRTPWDNRTELTTTQEYVQMHYVARYEDRHPKLKDDGESDMINSYKPEKCPYVRNISFKRGMTQSVYSVTDVNAASISNRQQEQFLIQEKFPSVSG